MSRPEARSGCVPLSFLTAVVAACGMGLLASFLLECFVLNEGVVPSSDAWEAHVSEGQPAWWENAQRPRCSLFESPFPRDFWFVKTKKVGGSTLAVIMDSVARRYGIVPIPMPEGQHGFSNAEQALLQERRAEEETGAEHFSMSRHMRYSVEASELLFRDPMLFTAIRHPLHRAYSQYYQKHQSLCPVGKRRPAGCWDDTEEAYMEFLEANRDFVAEYTRGDKEKEDHAGILDQYDFVFVTERFDESLVLFSLTFGVPLASVGYKKPLKNRQDVRPTASDKPEWLNNYTMSFYPNDLVLWNLANDRLDARRDAISSKCGPGAVEDALRRLELWKTS